MDASPPAGLRKAVAQRNQATACALLSIIISLALVMNQFLDRRQELKNANGQVLALQDAVRANQQALLDTQQTLGRLLESQAQGRIETRDIALWLEWDSPRDGTHFIGAGAGAPISSLAGDRGVANSGRENQIIREGDQVVLTPVIRAPDGNALGVKLVVAGPGLENSWTARASPMPSVFRGDQWVHDNYTVRFPKIGLYTVTVIGYSVWPVRINVVTYQLNVVGKES